MISIIAAVAANRAIGNDNKLIYWLPDDLKRFKALTTGHTIIMGRRTFESLRKAHCPTAATSCSAAHKASFQDAIPTLRLKRHCAIAPTMKTYTS